MPPLKTDVDVYQTSRRRVTIQSRFVSKPLTMPAPIELYRDSRHICLMFTDLVEEDGQAVQALSLIHI